MLINWIVEPNQFTALTNVFPLCKATFR